MASIAKPITGPVTPPKVTPNMVQSRGTTAQGVMKNGTTVPGETTIPGTELADTANKAYSNAVAVRDYATSKGYGGIVDWDGKNPTIGGSPVPMQYNENGTAYVDNLTS